MYKKKIFSAFFVSYWKRDSKLSRTWSDEFYRSTRCDRCNLLLISVTYPHNQKQYCVAYSISKSHGKGWLCHSCATAEPQRKSKRKKAYSTYEQLDNYLISKLKQLADREKEVWLGKKRSKTGNYTSINQDSYKIIE